MRGQETGLGQTGRASCTPARLPQVQWVLGAILPGPPPAAPDYENLQDPAWPAGWARSR